MDGQGPQGTLVQAANGELYGTTLGGGANNYGAVFRITSSGTLTTIYSFCSQSECADGETPNALVLATNGNLYGTTSGGGASDKCFSGGCGTVFELTPAGTLTTLYHFCAQSRACTDGEKPYAGLVQAANGDLYGTTFYGGANGGGTVFKITPGGTLTTLYSFCSQSECADGSGPYVGLVQAANGNFYGTTVVGGAYGPGTVFKITPSGTLTTLYSFCVQAGCPDGETPYAGLVQATDGNLYGTTSAGGADGSGTIFEITPNGTLTTLYNFCAQSGCTDGGTPDAGLVQATNGDLYGTTWSGGADNVGTVFNLSVGLAPFVKTLPTSGEVGAGVGILGSDLTGATSVTFNGPPATFTVVSRTLITATVPTGATTGKVEVTTPSDTLSTRNVNFQVLP